MYVPGNLLKFKILLIILIQTNPNSVYLPKLYPINPTTWVYCYVGCNSDLLLLNHWYFGDFVRLKKALDQKMQVKLDVARGVTRLIPTA